MQSTVPFNILHVMVSVSVASRTCYVLFDGQAVSQANVVNYTTIAVATPAQTEREFTISITHELVPKFNLLVFFAREDGELIADLMEVKVDCELKEKVIETT